MAKRAIEPQRWAGVSDMHVGSPVGLTVKPENPVQREVLRLYKECIKWFGPAPDVLVLFGDGIDGQDKRGNDLSEHNMFKQSQDCAEMLKMWKPKKEVIILTGTKYHTNIEAHGFEEHIKACLQYELPDVKITVTRKLKTTINGWFVLEGRHKITGSMIPHGRFTAQTRSKFWNIINAALTSMFKGKAAVWPNLTVFGHVHYDSYARDAFGASATMPCLHALGGRYGDEECDGHIDFGVTRLLVRETKEDGYLWESHVHPAGVVNRLEHR